MPLSEEQKEKMRLGRERARAEGRRLGGRPRRVVEAAQPQVAEPIAAASTVPVTETPEFKAAVQAATKEILAELVGKGPAPVSAGHSDDQKWVRELAIAVSEMADQGTARRPRIAPELLAQREAARKRMVALIAKAKRDGEVPVYELTDKVQLPFGDKGETLFEPLWAGTDHVHRATEIEWSGIPNQVMRPIGEPALSIFQAFSESIGNVVIEHDLDQTLAMTPGGVVVRGGAAQVLFRESGRDNGGPPIRQNGGDTAGIRRQQTAPTKEVHVLGTIAGPAVQNA